MAFSVRSLHRAFVKHGRKKIPLSYNSFRFLTTRTSIEKYSVVKPINNVQVQGFQQQTFSTHSPSVDVNGFAGPTYSHRTHLCGDLRLKHKNQKIVVCGWLQYHRGGFLILRDWKGLVQVILSDDKYQELRKINMESVLEVKGTVIARPEGQDNPAMPTGQVEIVVDSVRVLNPCKPDLRIEVHTAVTHKVGEHLRLQHRYLEMRLSKLQNTLRTRSQFVLAIRRFLAEKNDFVEVETPTLFRKTPGGAREFIVPTSTPDKFYSLPQSPQQFKQILMVGGIDRYFQIAKCYRDEGSKPDRQPEFTQVDLEMSFITQEDIYSLMETLLSETWPELCGKVNVPFPHMNYSDAMAKYGSDKPDMRIPWEICEVTNIFHDNCPPVFQSIQGTQGSSIQALCVPIATEFSKKQIEAMLTVLSREMIDMKIPYLKINPDKSMSGSIVKHLTPPVQQALCDVLHLGEGDLVFLAAGVGLNPNTALGKLRVSCANLLEEKGHSVREEGFHFMWIDNFPLFLPKEDGTPGLECTHHPFTSPHPDDEDLVYTKPEMVRGQHYDLVLNGCEVGGGSIRVHNSKLQRYILESVLKEDTTELSHLLEALDSGCPPHGGIALGLDRLMSIMLGTNSIRDVIAFPKTGSGVDPLSNAPASVDRETLDYYNIEVKKSES